MALDDKHPEYVMRLGEWAQMFDTYTGERAVKSKRLDYLPATEGMVQDGMTSPSSPGWKDYEAYLMRAYYHDVVKDAVKAALGLLHNKPAKFHLTGRLGDIMKKATIQGESLQQLHRRVNVGQLVHGRCGLLVDVPSGQDVNKALPYFSYYDPIRIINWDAGRLNEGRNQLQLVVLDEGSYRREGFTWKTERKFRILTRGTPESLESGWETPGGDAEFQIAVKVNDSSMPVAGDFLTPSIGGRTLKDIPFVFINANDLVPEPDVPPLLGLSNLALAIYRGEADYRQTLFLQGQNTLVLIGQLNDNDEDDDSDVVRTGNKATIHMREGGDAKMIGVSATGLGEMRQSLKNDRDEAAIDGVQFLSQGGAEMDDTGEAGRLRMAARTTTVHSIAVSAGQGLEAALKHAAEWVGDDPEQIKVEVATDFSDQEVAGAALLAMMQAKQLGLPLSLKSMHRNMAKNDLTELSYDEEVEQIDIESDTMLGMMVGPAFLGPLDGTFSDGEDPLAEGPDSGSTAPPAATVPPAGQPVGGPGSTAPRNSNVPIKPHLRGSPVPLKKKVGKKGASAGK